MLAEPLRRLDECEWIDAIVRRRAAGVGGAGDPARRGDRRGEGDRVRARRRHALRLGARGRRRGAGGRGRDPRARRGRPLLPPELVGAPARGARRGLRRRRPRPAGRRHDQARRRRGRGRDARARGAVAVQTPQAFVAPRVARRCARARAPDCASLVEAAGGRVKVVAGDERLLKVTTPADLERGDVACARGCRGGGVRRRRDARRRDAGVDGDRRRARRAAFTFAGVIGGLAARGRAAPARLRAARRRAAAAGTCRGRPVRRRAAVHRGAAAPRLPARARRQRREGRRGRPDRARRRLRRVRRPTGASRSPRRSSSRASSRPRLPARADRVRRRPRRQRRRPVARGRHARGARAPRPVGPPARPAGGHDADPLARRAARGARVSDHRVGIGVDAHALEEGVPLVLGGVSSTIRAASPATPTATCSPTR